MVWAYVRLLAKIHPSGVGMQAPRQFQAHLSTVLMAQMFECFNDMWRKAHNMELHLNKRKKLVKERGKVWRNMDYGAF